MSEKELVSFKGGGGLMKAEDLQKGLANFGSTIKTSGGMPFFRLLKNGRFAYGPEKIEPEEDSLWAINPYSLEHGYTCWTDGELLGEKMVPFNHALPNRADLQDFGENEWKQAVSLVMQCVSGEDTGMSVLYNGSAVGLKNAVGELIKQLVQQLSVDAVHCVPVVTLDVDSYEHKKYGTTYIPILEIVEWRSMEGNAQAPAVEDQREAEEGPVTAAEVENDAEPEPEPEPAPRRRRRAAAAEPAAEEKPKRQRRRRAQA